MDCVGQERSCFELIEPFRPGRGAIVRSFDNSKRSMEYGRYFRGDGFAEVRHQSSGSAMKLNQNETQTPTEEIHYGLKIK